MNLTTYPVVRRAAGCALIIASIGLGSQEARAQAATSAEELAKKLANPVAALISVPLQGNYDAHIGPDDEGERWTLNIQPVVPFDVSDHWNLISRTILPLVDQHDILPGAGGQSGVGDVVQSLFFSPKAPTAAGWIWGAGPVALFPTGSDDLLTTDQWGIGPTAVALKQAGPWTYGFLGNHLWSVAGDDDRADVNATLLQPFVTYTTPEAVSLTLVTETTYDWEAEQWTVPVVGAVAKVFNLGGQLVSLGAALKYYADSADGGPEDWGGRASVSFLFPK